MMHPLVRAATVADAPVVAALLAELGYATTSDEAARRIALLATDPLVETLVAELHGEVVGLATMHELAVINRPRPVVQLTALVVADAARSRGIGRALVQAVEERGRARGCERLTVTTHISREGAQRFYANGGFEHTGMRYGKVLVDDALPSGGV